MNTKTTTPVSVRIGVRERKELDAVARMLERDRSYVINEALRQYLDVQAWAVEHITQGIKDADAGRFASKREVKNVLR